MPRAHPRARRHAQPRRRRATRSTPGSASTRKTRSRPPHAPTSDSPQVDAPTLCGIPIGLKDLYAVAGKPLTASSTPARRGTRARLRRLGAARRRGHGAARPRAHARVRMRRHHRPGRQSVGARAIGRRLRAEGRARRSRPGRCPQPPGPTRPARCASPRPSAGRRRSSRRAGFVSMRGIVPLAPTFDHPGPMTRTVARLRAAARRRWPVSAAPASRRPLRRYAVSPRIADLEPDVADGFDRALAALPGRARRAAASGGTARRPRRLLRPRPHRDARLPPPLRRPARRVSPLESRAARARRAEGDDGRGVHRASQSGPHRGHRRLVRLARRAPHRRDRRADDPDRRTLARQRLRRGRSATSTISRSRTTGTGPVSRSSRFRPASGSTAGCR